MIVSKQTILLLLRKAVPVLVLVLLVAGSAYAQEEVQDIIRDLRYGTSQVRERAADSIRRRKMSEAESALVDILATAKGTFRLKVIQAMGTVGGRASLRPLLTLLKSPENDTRLLAVRAIGEIGDTLAEKKLLALLEDDDFEVRAEVALALGRVGSHRSVTALIRRLNDKNRVVRLSAVDALGRLGDERALDSLVKRVRSNDRSFRRHVVKAVGALHGSKRVRDRLGHWLEDKDVYLRGFAAEALFGQPKDPKWVGALLHLMDDEELGVRVRAVEVLGVWKATQAVPGLKVFLRDESEILRWKACEALGRIGDRAALDALKYTAENDANKGVREAALQAVNALEKK